MIDMLHFSRSKLVLLLPAVLLVAVAPPSPGSDGPYIGLEGGLNWQDPKNLSENGGVIDTLHFNRDWAAGLVGGYAFSGGWRPELEFDHRSNRLHRDTLGLNTTGEQLADSLYANIWYDLKAPTGILSVIQPYAGVGTGTVRYDNHGATPTGIGTQSYYSTEFGYQVGAGIGFVLTPQLTMSIDYRDLATAHGQFADGGGARTEARYGARSLLFGARYTFGTETPAEPPQVAKVAPEAPPPPAPPPAPPPPPQVAVLPPPCHAPAGFQVDADCHIIEQVVVVRAIDFEFNSEQLTIPAQQTLGEVAGALAAQPELTVEIQGHTDSIGTEAYNLKLSQRRADAVKAFLVGHGVQESRLVARGYGKSQPQFSNDTAEGRAQNRRVAFAISGVPAHVSVDSQQASAASTAAAEQGAQPKTRQHP
jgi:outer membrane protein OmpA-like peptidoglycan-associated protein